MLSQINEITTLHPSDGTLRHKDGSELFGIVKAILVPPEDFSPYFAHNFGSQEKPDRIYCVCFSCANKTSNLNFCYHKDELQRAISITTSVAELNYGIKEKKYKLLQLCELYAFEKGVHLFKDFVKNVDEFKGTLTDPTMIKFIKSGLNKSYGYFMLKNTQEKHKLCATVSEFQDLLENNDVIDFDPINALFKKSGNLPF